MTLIIPFTIFYFPACGYRSDWSSQEIPLPQYILNGTSVDPNTGLPEVELQQMDSLINAWPWVVSTDHGLLCGFVYNASISSLGILKLLCLFGK